MNWAAAEKLSRDQQNDDFIQDSAKRGLGNDQRVGWNRHLAHTNILANMGGQAPHVIDAALREYDHKLYTGMIETAGAHHPAAAIEYMDKHDEALKEAFSAKELNAFRDKYGKAKKDAEEADVINKATSLAIETARKAVASGQSPDKAVQSLYADLVREVGAETAQKVIAGYNVYDQLGDEARTEAEHASDRARLERERQEKEEDEKANAAAAQRGRWLADSGVTSEAEVRRMAHKEAKEKTAKAMIDAWQAERTAAKADKVVGETEREKTLDEEFEAAGHNIAKMPSFGKSMTQGGLTRKEIERYTDSTKKISPEKKLEPNSSVYLDALFNQSPEELTEILSDPERRDEFVNDLGGVSSPAFGRIYTKVKELLPGGKGAGGGKGKGDAVTTLDTDLNNVKREAEAAMARVGLYAGKDNKEKRDEAINDAVRFAKEQYEAEMAVKGVDDVKKLSVDVRNRIQADASFVVNAKVTKPGWLYGYNEETVTMTSAQAWANGVDISGATINPKSLLPELKRNYVDGGTVIRDGDTFMEMDIPSSALIPENIRAAGKRIFRDLDTGYWGVVTADDDYLEFSPGGITISEKQDADKKITLLNDAMANRRQWIDTDTPLATRMGIGEDFEQAARDDEDRRRQGWLEGKKAHEEAGEARGERLDEIYQKHSDKKPATGIANHLKRNR